MAGKPRHPTTFHSGSIQIKISPEKDYKKRFVQLQGIELILFASEQKSIGQNIPIENRISLNKIQQVKKEWSTRAKFQKSIFPTIVLLYNDGKEVRIRAEVEEDREIWFRYLEAVGKTKLPDDTSGLLPGQVHGLKDAILEVERLKLNEDNRMNEVHEMPPHPGREFNDCNDYMDMNATMPQPPLRTTSLQFLPLPNPLRSSAPPRGVPVFPPQVRSPTMTQPVPVTPQKPPSAPRTAPKPVCYRNQPTNQRKPADLPRSPQQAEPPKHEQNGSKRHSWMFDEVLGRGEAEEILMNNEEYGNLIVRKRKPSEQGDEWTHAVSVKPQDAREQTKHFKVKTKKSFGRTEYVVNLSDMSHRPLHSLEEVVDYFVETNKTYKPMTNIREVPVNVYADSIQQPTEQRIRDETEIHQAAMYENQDDGKDYSNVTNDVRRHNASTLPSSGRQGNRSNMIRQQTTPELSSFPGYRMLPEEPGYLNTSNRVREL